MGNARQITFGVLLLISYVGAIIAQTGGGATLVGTVKDSSGAVVAGAKVKVVNTETSFFTETTTLTDGGYYVPYLIPGNYRVTVNASGFKEFVRDGLNLRSAEVPRVDILLEVGSVNDSVTVSAAASLLNTENVVSSYVLPAQVLTEVPGLMKRTVYVMQYMPGVIAVQGQAGFHIAGQAQNDIGASLDGVTAKSPYTGVVNQVDGVVQGSTDAMEEVKVLTTGVSAEYGHSSGGKMQMVYKSGTNSLHGSFDDRYLPGSWTHRAYLTQFPTPPNAPWYYETFDLVGSGPVIIPKIYNGKNKTFWLSDYDINHEHTINYTQTTVPTEAMLNGDFSFPEAAGGGLPIYNPFSYRQVNGTWTADPLPGNIVPKSLMDPVALKYLTLGIWAKPNQPGTPSRTGPSNNLQSVQSCRCLHRDRWDEKIDHQFSSSQKIFFRYSQYHNRGQNGDNFANADFNSGRYIAPTDDINGVINYTTIISPVMFNEFRIGYNRRATSNPPRPDATKYGITVPGASTESFPYFNIGYSIGGMTVNRNVGEDRVLQDNLTRLAGKHSIKVGYEMIWTLYSDEAAALPGGQYNFSGGTSLPFTPNTGNDFAAFEMGAVTSATFTRPQGLFLPRLWDHELYVQDDWKVRPNVSLNLGVRWTYSSPFKTKWNQQSQFDPNAVDPVTGLMGAITHPKGIIGKRDLNNFQPRLGLSWNFMPKWVFRASFAVMTSDNNGQGGFDEYNGVYNILQPTGDPRYVFLLKDGPGQVQYKVNPDGTVPYTGASYSSRTATWRDPNLRNPYIMNWSAGFQFQVAPTWLATATYQGTAGVGLVRSWNIDQIPLSIALGGNTALQDKVYASQQNYLLYPQFGSVNYLSNFNHNTWHSGNFAIEKRYARGLSLNATFNWSKSLSNEDSLSYYSRAGKARTAYDQELAFGGWVIYELPVGKGQRWLNRGGVWNTVLGGWKLDLSENILSGIPVSVGYSGSPYKYLTATRVNALEPVDQIKTPDWTIGNRFPTAAQTPYFDMNAFTYPASYTIGAFGARGLQAPGLLWMQCFATKSWSIKERAKLSLRLDGHNLPWKRPNLSAPGTTYNLNNPGAFGRFTGTVGDFSNFGTPQANVQANIRVEF
jgi:hypothetical protein